MGVTAILTSLAVVLCFSGLEAASCRPRNCIWGVWSDWSDCSQTCGSEGQRTRHREVLGTSVCGGICPGAKQESKVCNRRCCPRNCQFSEWSSWNCVCARKACDETAAEREICYRHREKTTEQSCGGFCRGSTVDRRCGGLCCYKDCVLSQWSQWGWCDAQCEQQGTRSRSRKIAQPPMCGGNLCPRDVYQEEVCTGPCCSKDCFVGEWGEWGDCNNNCGEGSENRTRVVREGECGGRRCAPHETDVETRACEKHEHVDCKMGPWGKWAECVLYHGHCGEGTQTRRRAVLRQGQCRGKPCGQAEQTRACQGTCCVADCEVGDWSGWSFCSTDCGKGLKFRTRNIIQPRHCGGRVCPPLKEALTCEEHKTQDCQLSEWSEWSPCSNDCGTGNKVRSRRKLRSATCGGTCVSDDAMEESAPCEDFRANRDCQITQWGPWSNCLKNCLFGLRMRNRTIIQNEQCQGRKCPKYTQAYDHCPIKCQHLCNNNACGCRPGYVINPDGYTCRKIMCAFPRQRYCPPGHLFLKNCWHVSFRCSAGRAHPGDICQPECSNGWVLRGVLKNITCQDDGTWDMEPTFCALKRRNYRPLGIKASTKWIQENTAVGSCPISLITSTLGELEDHHTYTIPEGETSTELYLRGDDKLCLKVTPDYEQPPPEWSITVRSTDTEGLYVDEQLTFVITDVNDKPRDLQLSNNTIAENSKAPVFIGYVTAQNDESSQTLTMSLADTSNGLFKLEVNDLGDNELWFVGESDPRCFTEGNTWCSLNREVQPQHLLIVLVKDNGLPAESEYFDVFIELTDVNDKPTAVKLEPPGIWENVTPGDKVAELVTVDEDSGEQSYLYELLEDADGLFYLENNTLRATDMYDYETQKESSWTIRLRATDSGDPPLSVDQDLVLQVVNLNEKPFDLRLTSVNGQVIFEDNQPAVRENSKIRTVIGTVTAKDDDEDEKLTFTLTNATDLFTIGFTLCTHQGGHTYCGAQLHTTHVFNYEQQPTMDFAIKATDRDGLSTTQTLVLNILDVNDAPMKILINDTDTDVLYVPEARNSYPIGILSTVDEDSSDSHVYFLKETADGKFKVVNNVLMTSSSAGLDYEAGINYAVTVVCHDDGSPPLETELNVTVIATDVNEAPTGLRLSKHTIKENSARGTIIGVFQVTDPDNSIEATQSFWFELIDDAEGRFSVYHNQLAVSSSNWTCGHRPCELNFEDKQRHSVSVLVTDTGHPPLSKQFSFYVNVLDANDKPRDTRLSNNEVFENEEPGTKVGVLMAVEEDPGQTETFTLLTHQDLFEIVNGDQLVTKAVLDYEQQPMITITVETKDNASPPAKVNADLPIYIKNRNEAPVVVDEALRKVSSTTFRVAEALPPGFRVGQIRVFDPEPPEAISFKLQKYQDIFEITNVNCVSEKEYSSLCTADMVQLETLHYEDVSKYQFDIKIADAKGLEVTLHTKVSVLDVNEAPKDILINGASTQNLYIEENSQDISLGTLSAVEEDAGQSVTFHVEGTDNFDVVENHLMVRPDAYLDYEVEPVMRLTVVAADDGLPVKYLRKEFIIHLLNVNDPPSSLYLSKMNITENSPAGAVVGTLMVRDEDDDGEELQHDYDFVLLDTAEGRFRLDGDKVVVAQGENTLCSQYANQCWLNFEQQSSYNIRVKVTDTGSPPISLEAPIRIRLLDVNDPPRDVTIDNYIVKASSDQGTEVGTLQAQDEDADQDVTFELIDSDGPFSVSERGSVSKSTAAALAAGSVITMTVQVSDTGIPPSKTNYIFSLVVVSDEEAPVTISVVAEGSSLNFESFDIKIPESFSEDKVLGTVIGVNENNNDLNFNLVDETASVKLDPNITCTEKESKKQCKATLRLGGSLDFESQPAFSLTLRATDSSTGLSTALTRSVTVVDVNESPLAIIFSSYYIKVKENTQNEAIGEFIVIDPDRNDFHSLTLSEDAGVFELRGQGMLWVASGAQLDHERQREYTITVVAVDSDGLSIEQSFTVNILDINEQPSSLLLDNYEVPENSPGGTLVGTLLVTDPDNGADSRAQNFTYELLDDSGSRFLIDDDKLLVAYQDDVSVCNISSKTTGCLLNFEKSQEHNLVIKVSDSGHPPSSNIFSVTVKVTDVNDPPYAFELTNQQNGIMEDWPIGEPVAHLTAKDEDALAVDGRTKLQSLTFQILNSHQNYFTLEGKKVILLKKLDFETEKEHLLQIAATDDTSQPLTVVHDVVLRVLNVNEPPTDLKIVPPSVDHSFLTNHPVVGENAPSKTTIGLLQALDPDEDDRISFRVNSDTFAVEEPPECTNGNIGTSSNCTAKLILTAPVNYEVRKEYEVYVDAVDSHGLTVSINFTVVVQDRNDKPTEIHLLSDETWNGTLEVAETAQGDALTLGKFFTVDEDTNQTYIYSLFEDVALFEMINNTLIVAPGPELDYETQREYTFTLRSTDSGNPKEYVERTVTVVVLNVNEPPTHLYLSKHRISEKATVGTEIGQLSVDDPDAANGIVTQVSFSLTNDSVGRFAIDGSLLLVGEKPDFDYEKQQNYTVAIRVHDHGEPSFTVDFNVVVVVTDTNEPPYDLKLFGDAVSETAPFGFVVGNLSASDPDYGQSVTFALKSESPFGITGNQLVVNGPLDYEKEKSLTVQVVALDDGIPTSAVVEEFTIYLIDEDEPPAHMQLTLHGSDGSPQNLTLIENVEPGTIIGEIEVFDPDNGDFVNFTILGDAASDTFSLEEATCSQKSDDDEEGFHTKCVSSVKLLRKLSHEHDPKVVLKARATDKGGLFVQNTWEILVLNTNDAPTNITIDGNPTKLVEHTRVTVGALRTTDEDVNDSHHYLILTHHDVFRIDSGHLLVVKDRDLLDYEVENLLEVEIQAIDDGVPPLSVTKTFTFNVEDTNERPRDILLSNKEVASMAEPGEVVGIITVDDPDNSGPRHREPKQTHTCEVTDSGNYFTYNAERAALEVLKQLPENMAQEEVTIECTDSGEPPMSIMKRFIIPVMDSPDLPKLIKYTGKNSIVENEGSTELGVFRIVDAMNEVPIPGTYEFQLLNESQPFSIDANGSLYTSGPLNNEDRRIWAVDVRVQGTTETQHQADFEQMFLFHVEDVNEAPVGLGIYGQLRENSPEGSIVGDIHAMDEDQEQSHTYELLGVVSEAHGAIDDSLSDLILLENHTLVLGPLADLLDFETLPFFGVVIRANDSGEPSLTYEGTVYVSLLNENEPPTDLSVNNTMVSENSGNGTVVSEISIVDDDREDNHTCVIQNKQSTPFEVFRLQLQVWGDLDYETERTYAIELLCRDAGLLEISRVVTINVINLNEPPSYLDLSNLSIMGGNEESQTVAEILATDPDAGDEDLLTFTILSEDVPFAVGEEGVLLVTETLDASVQDRYEIEMEVTDPKGLSISRTFTILVIPEPVAPTDILLEGLDNGVPEDAKNGTIIGTLSTVGSPDSFYVYVLMSQPSPAPFGLDGDKLVVVQEGLLDHESEDEIILTMLSKESGNLELFIEVNITVQITDVNEPPEAVDVAGLRPVPENSAPGTEIATIIVDDPDDQPVSTFSCYLEEEGDFFQLEFVEAEDRIVLMTAGEPVDFEEKSSYDLMVSCSDGEYDIEQPLTVSIEDVNEAPSNILLSGPLTVDAKADPGDLIGQLAAEDPDIGQRATFSVIGPNSDLVQVKDDWLVVKSAIPQSVLLDDTPQLLITIEATDNGQPTLTFNKIFTLTINDIDDSILPNLVLKPRTVYDNATTGDVVGKIYIHNSTLEASKLEFTLVDDAEGLFELVGNELVLSGVLDYARSPSHQIVVEATAPLLPDVAVMQSFTVVVVSTLTCPGDCGPYSRCVRGEDDMPSCMCVDGYNSTEESTRECFMDTGCGDKACEHGICFGQSDDFVCECSEGYAGPSCELKLEANDPCSAQPCFNSGGCRATPEAERPYSCMCAEGWEGDHCENSADDCAHATCYGQSECVDKHRTYICECPDGYEGLRCEFHLNDCEAQSCQTSELCVPKFDEAGHYCINEKSRIVVEFGDGVGLDLEFKARFLDFFYDVVNVFIESPAAKEETRKRREIADADSYLYIMDTNGTSGEDALSFVVLTKDGHPYTREEALQQYDTACGRVLSGNDSDVSAPFCSELQAAALMPDEDEDDTGTSVLVCVVAVVGCLAALVLIVGVTIYLVGRRRQRQESEAEGQRRELMRRPVVKSYNSFSSDKTVGEQVMEALSRSNSKEPSGNDNDTFEEETAAGDATPVLAPEQENVRSWLISTLGQHNSKKASPDATDPDVDSKGGTDD